MSNDKTYFNNENDKLCQNSSNFSIGADAVGDATNDNLYLYSNKDVNSDVRIISKRVGLDDASSKQANIDIKSTTGRIRITSLWKRWWATIGSIWRAAS